VENFVENFASILKSKFKNTGNLTTRKTTCAKLFKSHPKKIFQIEKKLVSSQFFVIFSKKLLKV